MRWDLGRPYLNRRGTDGYCHQCDPGSHACGVYEQRPSVCRRYSCANDARIWKDFDAMELNHEWIDANLGGERPGPVEIFMDAARERAAEERLDRHPRGLVGERAEPQRRAAVLVVAHGSRRR